MKLKIWLVLHMLGLFLCMKENTIMAMERGQKSTPKEVAQTDTDNLFERLAEEFNDLQIPSEVEGGFDKQPIKKVTVHEGLKTCGKKKNFLMLPEDDEEKKEKGELDFSKVNQYPIITPPFSKNHFLQKKKLLHASPFKSTESESEYNPLAIKNRSTAVTSTESDYPFLTENLTCDVASINDKEEIVSLYRNIAPDEKRFMAAFNENRDLERYISDTISKGQMCVLRNEEGSLVGFVKVSTLSSLQEQVLMLENLLKCRKITDRGEEPRVLAREGLVFEAGSLPKNVWDLEHAFNTKISWNKNDSEDFFVSDSWIYFGSFYVVPAYRKVRVGGKRAAHVLASFALRRVLDDLFKKEKKMDEGKRLHFVYGYHKQNNAHAFLPAYIFTQVIHEVFERKQYSFCIETAEHAMPLLAPMEETNHNAISLICSYVYL